MHLKSTPESSTEVYLTREANTTRTEEHSSDGVNTTRRTASFTRSSTAFTASANGTTPRAESSKSNHNNDFVKGDFGAEVISGCVIGAVAGVVLIAVVVITLYKMKRKRSNVRTARSNTQMSFDNLSYDGDVGDQRNSEFVDMTDFEVLRSNIVSSIKRKVSAFSISASKENEQENSRKISCGRLSIVETLESTSVNIGEIVQTIEV